MYNLNQAHITWEQCVETNDSLMIIIDSCSGAFQVFTDQISAIRSEVTIKQSQVIERDTLIAQQGRVIHHREQQIIRLKWHKGFLGTLDAVLIGVIGYLIIFK